MKIILHELTNLNYLSLEKSLNEKAISFKHVDQQANEINYSHHGSFHEFVEVAVPVTQIAISALTIWLNTRKPKKGRKITFESEDGIKVTIELDNPEAVNIEVLKDVKDILEQLTKF